jgi:hypothetical protein
MGIVDRIYDYVEYKRVTISEFSKIINVSSGYFAKQKSNNANIGSNIIEKIIKSYPEINLYWLITGEGNMLRKVESSQLAIDCVSCKQKDKIIELQEKLIKSYEQNCSREKSKSHKNA